MEGGAKGLMWREYQLEEVQFEGLRLEEEEGESEEREMVAKMNG